MRQLHALAKMASEMDSAVEEILTLLMENWFEAKIYGLFYAWTLFSDVASCSCVCTY